MLRSSRVATALVAGAAALAGVAATAVPASASMNVPASASIINRVCSGAISWWGGETAYSTKYNVDTRSHGTVKICYAVYKFNDSNTSYDWYAADLQTVWTNASGSNTNAAAVLGQTISSGKYTSDNDYSATPTYKSSTSCSTPINVGLTATTGVFEASVSTPIQLCSGYTVTRGSFGQKSASWTTPKVGKSPSVETGYHQKVTAGRPTYTFTVMVPYYSYSYNGSIWVRAENYRWYTYKI